MFCTSAIEKFKGSIPAGVSFSPDQIASIVHWYDDTGQSVSSWTDKIGSDPLLQATGGNQPSKISAAQNGRSVLRFDGATSFMHSTGAWIKQVTQYTLFFARKCSNDSSSPVIWSGSVGQDFAQLLGGNIKFDTDNSAANTLPSSNNFLTSAFRLDLSASGIVNQLRYWLNGAEQTSQGTGGASPATTSNNTTFYLGNYTGTLLFCPCDVGEIIIYSAALSPANIALVSAYLKSRWGTP